MTNWAKSQHAKPCQIGKWPDCLAENAQNDLDSLQNRRFGNASPKETGTTAALFERIALL